MDVDIEKLRIYNRPHQPLSLKWIMFSVLMNFGWSDEGKCGWIFSLHICVSLAGRNLKQLADDADHAAAVVTDLRLREGTEAVLEIPINKERQQAEREEKKRDIIKKGGTNKKKGRISFFLPFVGSFFLFVSTILSIQKDPFINCLFLPLDQTCSLVCHN